MKYVPIPCIWHVLDMNQMVGMLMGACMHVMSWFLHVMCMLHAYDMHLISHRAIMNTPLSDTAKRSVTSIEDGAEKRLSWLLWSSN